MKLSKFSIYRPFRPPLTPPNLGGEMVTTANSELMVAYKASTSPPKFLPCKRPTVERGGVRGGLNKWKKVGNFNKDNLCITTKP